MALKLALGLTGQGKDVFRKQGGTQRAKDLRTSIMDAVGYMGTLNRCKDSRGLKTNLRGKS